MQTHRFRTIVHSSHLRLTGALLALALASACSHDALLSPDGARPRASESGPAITVTPDSVTVGDTAVTVTVRGRGFNEMSHIYSDPYLPLITTFVNDSTLEGRLEWPPFYAGMHQVYVYTETYTEETVSFETTQSAPFVIANPSPGLTATSPDWAPVDAEVERITVRGRGFVYGAEVQWNGSPRYTQVWSDTLLVFYPNSYDFWEKGQVEVTVLNPAPSRGPSEALVFEVGARTFLHTAGATAGSQGLRLVVYGEGFGNDWKVYWNGQERSTQFSSSGRISAWIPASDLAAPGEGRVTVVPPAWRQEKPLRAGTVTVRTAGPATVTSQIRLDLPVRDLVYVPSRDRLYATVYAGPLANHLAVIDPNTGAVENAWWVGQEPRYLAASDNGRYLWVGLDGENAVQAIDLEYGYPTYYRIQLGSGMVAEDLEVVPGEEGRVAVARKNTCCSPRHEGVALYSYGSPFPNETSAGIGSNVIAFGATPSVLYGLDNESSGSRSPVMRVDDTGVVTTYAGWSLSLTGYPDFAYAAGRLYLSSGGVLDTGWNDWVGFIGQVSGAVHPDARTGRAFFLGDDGIRVADINTYHVLGTIPVPPLSFEHPATQRKHVVRWGADGLAYHDADEVFIIRSPIAGP